LYCARTIRRAAANSAGINGVAKALLESSSLKRCGTLEVHREAGSLGALSRRPAGGRDQTEEFFTRYP